MVNHLSQSKLKYFSSLPAQILIFLPVISVSLYIHNSLRVRRFRKDLIFIQKSVLHGFINHKFIKILILPEIMALKCANQFKSPEFCPTIYLLKTLINGSKEFSICSTNLQFQKQETFIKKFFMNKEYFIHHLSLCLL